MRLETEKKHNEYNICKIWLLTWCSKVWPSDKKPVEAEPYLQAGDISGMLSLN